MLWRLVAAMTLVCFGGCSFTATIARTDGPDSEARIESSDAGALYVGARNGRIYRIPRESVSGIDHPGNVEILIGGLLLSVIAAGVAANYDNRNQRDDLLVVWLVYGIPALALITSGLVKYVPSVRAAHAFESPELAPAGAWMPAPTPAPSFSAPPPVPPVAPAPSPPPPPAEPEPEVIPGPTSPP